MSIIILKYLLGLATCILILMFLVLALTRKGRAFARAAKDALFTEANKNPKIVASYYDQEIERVQKAYNNVDDAYRKASGEKLSAEREVEELGRNLEELKALVVESQQHGDVESARMYAQEAIETEAIIKVKKENIRVFEDAMRSSGKVRKKAEDAIRQLKLSKKKNLEKVKSGQAAQEIYSKFDANRTLDDIDQILGQFEEYANEQEKMGLGARASWEESHEAKRIEAKERAMSYQTDDYIAKLVESVTENN